MSPRTKSWVRDVRWALELMPTTTVHATPHTYVPHGKSDAHSDPCCLDIALINNMPDAALDATERQFRALLGASGEGVRVRLTLYSLPEVRRTDFGRKQVASYAPLDELWHRRYDGLIVTGTEPIAAD